MRRAALALTAAAALAAALPPLATVAHAYPQPSPYPVAWQFDFTYDQPRRIVVDTPRGRQAFFYMTYTVTNNTDQERPFLPVFEMMTKDGRILRSDRGVPAGVFGAIVREERNDLLLDSLDVSDGPLLLGEDRQRQGVAIWPEPTPEMGTFKIYVGGLSGETATVEVGGETVRNDEGRPVLLFKTKELTFRQLGDDQRPGNDPLVQVDEDWVMR